MFPLTRKNNYLPLILYLFWTTQYRKCSNPRPEKDSNPHSSPQRPYSGPHIIFYTLKQVTTLIFHPKLNPELTFFVVNKVFMKIVIISALKKVLTGVHFRAERWRHMCIASDRNSPQRCASSDTNNKLSH
jgi:hypothetical protein